MDVKMTASAASGSSPWAQNRGGRRRFLAELVSFVAFGGFLDARADLPIHATVSDVRGQWLFSLSPPIRGTVHSCGSTIPNRNSSNLRPELQDYKAFLETQGEPHVHEFYCYKAVPAPRDAEFEGSSLRRDGSEKEAQGVHKQVRLHLTDTPVPFVATRTHAAAGRPNRQLWKGLAVFDGENPNALVGSWTTVYDEGFEVHVGGDTRMMGFMKYSLDLSCQVLPQDGDLEDASGNTKCYATDARQTHMGWYSQQQENGELLSGCFHAERVDSPSSSSAAFVVIDEPVKPNGAFLLSATPAVAGVASAPRQVPSRQDLTYYISEEFITDHNSSPTTTWKAGRNPVFAQADASILSNYIKDTGVRKLYRGGSERYETIYSFVQSESGSSTQLENPSSIQVYACPCKKGERRLDTRLKNDEAPVPVLSPLSALQLGDARSFLASISPHPNWSRSLSYIEEKGSRSDSANGLVATVHEVRTEKAPVEKLTDTQAVPMTALERSAQKLPEEFSWSDPFSSAAFDEEVVNQGSCGSCYAIAGTYTLQKRFEIAASKMLGRDVKLFGTSQRDGEVAPSDASSSFVDLRESLGVNGNLSAQSVLSCSFYNQGCAGGFPYLVGKHAREVGIPQENCMSYQATDSEACPFQPGRSSSLKSESHSSSSVQSLLETGGQACASQARWYASDYGYVGGCYECNQCSGEKLIMEEVYQNGPVAAALEAPSSLFSYQEGVYDVDPLKHRHSRVCDVSTPACAGFLTGWEFTNHAVSIVGWGEDKPDMGGDNGNTRKYWIVRNTWGPLWGKRGYVKIARGKNLAGIESQVTWMDPDFTRGLGRKVAERIEALKAAEAASA